LRTEGQPRPHGGRGRRAACSLVSIAALARLRRDRTMSSKFAKIAGPLIGVVAALHVAFYFPRCVDDLFISLRFAESFARGDGIVFNPGERVEGYSSATWMASRRSASCSASKA
jgi:hypothetical protein